MAATEKISITITKQMKESLDVYVASGAYASTSEVIREAIRNWQDDRWETPEQIAYMKRKVREAMDDSRPMITLEESKARFKLYAQSKKVAAR